MRFRKKYNLSEIVTDDQLEAFNARCEAVLHSLNITPSEESFPLFGSAVLMARDRYLSFVRSFVKFLMAYPFFDETLCVLYPHTPRGAIVMEEKAISHFILYQYTPPGDPVIDAEVSQRLHVSEYSTYANVPIVHFFCTVPCEFFAT